MSGGAVLIGTMILYLAVGMILLLQRKPFRAGAAMMAVTPLPLMWQVMFTDSDMPGFVFFFLIMQVPALAVMLLGVVAALYRWLGPEREARRGEARRGEARGGSAFG